MDIHRNLSNIAKGRKAKRNRLLEEQKQLGMEVDDTEFEKEVEVNIDDIEIAPIKESSSVVQLFTGWCPFVFVLEFTFPLSLPSEYTYIFHLR